MYVISYVQPPKDGAAFGKATVSDPLPERQNLHTVAYWALRKCDPCMHPDVVNRYAKQIMRKDLGVESVEASTGLIFRIDDADNPPNVCPCCGRLNKPGEDAFAGVEDAYCLGCFTWKRGMTACLPANTAHSENESES